MYANTKILLEKKKKMDIVFADSIFFLISMIEFNVR